MIRLHIVGCHRSGTTLMFEMITSCFVHDGRCDHEKTIFNPVEPVDGLYVGKKPSDITHIHRVFRQDEQLHLIYLQRDPRAVITSIHPSRGDQYFASFERWQRYRHSAAQLEDHPRFVTVRFEDLILRPDTVQKTLEQRFDFLEELHPFSEYERWADPSPEAGISLGGVRTLDPAVLTAWHNHLPRLAFQLQRYPELAQVLVEQGYEDDDSWMDLLSGVTARSQQYGERTPGAVKRWETSLRYWLKSRQYLQRLNSQ